MSVLIVVAHPDDEVLGCGGIATALSFKGCTVRACILSGKVDAREHRPDLPDLREDILSAQKVMGCGEPILGDFPNIELNTVPHIQLVRFIEEIVVKTGAHTIFTHHPADLNNDHLCTSRACQAAARLFQRRAGVPALKGLHFMGVLSATDWAFPSGDPGFRPDTFFELSEALFERKLRALEAYRGVMRESPHSRSEEVLRALATYRGAQAGIRYAEAFQTAFRAVSVANPEGI